MEDFDGTELMVTQNAQLQGIRCELRALRLMQKARLTEVEREMLEEAERGADEIADVFGDEPPVSCGMA